MNYLNEDQKQMLQNSPLSYNGIKVTDIDEDSWNKMPMSDRWVVKDKALNEIMSDKSIWTDSLVNEYNQDPVAFDNNYNNDRKLSATEALNSLTDDLLDNGNGDISDETKANRGILFDIGRNDEYKRFENYDDYSNEITSFRSHEGPKTDELDESLFQVNKQGVMPFISRELLKPALKGLAGIPDVAVMLTNLIGQGVNKATGKNVFKDTPLLSDKIGEGVDYLTGGLSEGDPKTPLGLASEFASGVASGGVLAKGVKAAMPNISSAGKKATELLGSTKQKDVLNSVVSGGSIDALERYAGVDPLVSTAIGIVAPAAVSKGGRAISDSSLDKSLRSDSSQKALLASERLSPDSPLLTRSDLDNRGYSKIAEQLARNTPVYGAKISAQDDKKISNFQKIFADVSESIGLKKDQKGSDVIKGLYDKARDLSAGINSVQGAKSVETARKLVNDSEKAIVTSSQTSKVNREAKKIIRGFNDELGSLKGIPIDVLIATKKEVNRMINFDKFHDKYGYDLKQLSHSIDVDIRSAGKKHPEFLDAFNKANDAFKGMSKRKKFDDMFAGQVVNPNEKINVHKFISLADPEKIDKKRIVNNLLTPALQSKLDDLVTVAKAYSKSNISNPNPSGTAKTAASISLIVAIASGNFKTAVVSATTAATLGRFFTNKKAVNRAIAYAKDPSAGNLNSFEKTFLSQTGVSVNKLMKDIQEESVDENEINK